MPRQIPVKAHFERNGARTVDDERVKLAIRQRALRDLTRAVFAPPCADGRGRIPDVLWYARTERGAQPTTRRTNRNNGSYGRQGGERDVRERDVRCLEDGREAFGGHFDSLCERSVGGERIERGVNG
jgi:hypothetical protein